MAITILPTDTKFSVSPLLDIDQLREEGRKHLESLSSSLWTDYNLHDPGITILEMLVYALTDLGIRTQQDMVDLLAGHIRPETADAPIDFRSPPQIFPNLALTPPDYRRLLIDHIPDTKHKGLYDVHLYAAERLKPEIRYQEREDALENPLSYGPGELIQIRGLYQAKVEFGDERDENWIEIDQEWLDAWGIPLTYRWQPLQIFFPSWKNLRSNSLWNSTYGLESGPLRITDLRLMPGGYLRAEIAVRWTSGAEVPLTLRIRSAREASSRPYPESTGRAEEYMPPAVVRRALEEEILPRLLPAYLNRFRRIQSDLQYYHHFLCLHRNVCEDWEPLEAIQIQQIGVHIDRLHIHPPEAGSPQEVMIEVYTRMDEFITPVRQFLTLEEMLASGLCPDEFYEGPLLEHGFLPQDRLDTTFRGGYIYTSDLMALIMDIPGVIGVEGLRLCSYIHGQEVASEVTDCLRLRDPENFRPRFSSFYSNILIFQQESEIFRAGPDTNHLYKPTLFLRGNRVFRAEYQEWELPEGQKLTIEEYDTIQEDFPNVYKLKRGAVLPQDTDLRKAQVNQLKGYLVFFEQLLANYCSQLAHIHDIFSLSPEVSRTYFFQDLYELPEIEPLFREFVEGSRTWDVYRSRSNRYTTVLGTELESIETFLARRNGFTDHLLARFAESFSEYAAWTYMRSSRELPGTLIQDKLVFLNEYPELSSARARAASYYEEDPWDTYLVSGVKKRISRLLGMPDYSRRDLLAETSVRDHVEIYDETDRVVPDDGVYEPRFRIRLRPIAEDPESKILLSSNQAFPPGSSRPDGGLSDRGEQELEEVLSFLGDRSRYEIFIDAVGKYRFRIRHPSRIVDGELDKIARRAEPFDSLAEAEWEINRIISLAQNRAQEGFFVVEHVLLRPLAAEDALLNPSLYEQMRESLTDFSAACGNIKDPYSFQVTVIYPIRVGRFEDEAFRKILEKLIRLEFPAHILVHILPVNANREPAFRTFQEAYREWLEFLYGSLPIPIDPMERDRLLEERTRLLNSLIDILHRLITGG